MSPEAEFFLRQSSVSVELLATQRVEHWQRALSRPGGIFDTSVALARAGPDASAFRTQVRSLCRAHPHFVHRIIPEALHCCFVGCCRFQLELSP